MGIKRLRINGGSVNNNREIYIKEVIELLKEINSKMDTIIITIGYPKSAVEKILEYGGAGVSILGILSIIDLIRTWIFGG
jgi:hypothetical protein